MAPSLQTTVLALSMLLTLFTSVHAGDGTEECGEDITQQGEFYAIKFFSFCQTRLNNGATSLPVMHSDHFTSCAAACVEQGITCGGFAYDRDSHYGAANCYLLQAQVAAWQTSTPEENVWFDSAIVDNRSLPLTRRDCETTGVDGIYNDMQLYCNQGIHDLNVYRSQINTAFAASLSDCVDLCKNYTYDECQAVTWDASMVYGYQNCIMKGANYLYPTVDVAWDSATLLNTQGYRPPPDPLSSVSSVISYSSTASYTSVYSQTALGTASPQQFSNSTLSTGSIAGIVVGVVAFIGVFIGILMFCLIRRKHKKTQANNRDLTVQEVVHTTPDGVPTEVDKNTTTVRADQVATTNGLPPPSYTVVDPAVTIQAGTAAQ